MTAVDTHATVFLSLDTLTPNRDVALSLPGDVARRYHALPIAQDNGRVTVVMANPADQTAREAVEAALTVKTRTPWRRLVGVRRPGRSGSNRCLAGGVVAR